MNIIKTNNGNINLIGKAFMKKFALYKKPVDSTIFDIYIIEKIDDKLQYWNYLEIKKKIMVIKHNGILVAMPIIHTT